MSFIDTIKNILLFIAFGIAIRNVYVILFSKPVANTSQPIIVVSSSGDKEEIQKALIEAINKLNEAQNKQLQESSLIGKLDRIASALAQATTIIR